MSLVLTAGAAAGCAAALGSGILWLRRFYTVVTVSGTSMEPTFRQGDRVVVRRTGVRRLKCSSVVVVRDLTYIRGPLPHGARLRRGDRQPAVSRTGPCLIKRVAALPGDPVPREGVPALRHVPETVVPAGRLVLLGDNRDASYDSREHGYFFTDQLLGHVVGRLDG
ncbi:S26 family signal peptidase [Streptomyces heliomycini]|uniref:S26 family signal peptidase n=1 Tax=Streptomyces heliomycini TaxID=284032 RepID=A0ABV5LAJ7_9ACTN|nr:MULTISPECIES: S26 family signal peptidase [Streptomyces]